MHTKDILSKYGATPSKRLGQNFLIDRNVLQKIIKTADLKPDDAVLEVGPGIGTLTRELAERAGKVIAVEKDLKMRQILQETTKNFNNIDMIQENILKFLNPKSQITNYKQIQNSKFKIPKNYKVVANIPYYLTSPLIRGFLENKHPPTEMVLMVQKEVAQRICAKPPNMNLLAVSVQFYAKPKIISYVSKNCFWPAPKVDSAIIKITPSKSGGLPMSPGLFFKVIKAGFSQPRKQLVNNLLTLSRSEGSKMLTKEEISARLLKNKINPGQRAETLTIADWINLAKSFKTE